MDKALLEKRMELRYRLDLALSQVEAMEHQASLGNRINSSAFQIARAEFNKLIPNGKVAFGCKSTCMIFCHCSDHLFKPEKLERHKLYMRYFDAKEVAEAHISEVEQTSFAIPGVKQRSEVVQKRKTNNHRLPAQEEEQLEIEL